jgi:hypothetical protein
VRVFLRRSADASGDPGQDPAAAQKSGSPAQAGGAGLGAVNGTANGTANGAASPADRASVTAGKGRPTPKRSEAQRQRRQPYSAPADRKSAYKQTRGRDKEERSRKYAAMRRGEAWALAPKDQGPVRALARDYVDSRHRISEYYMYGLGVLVVLLFLPATRLIVDWLVLAVVLVMLAEGSFLGRQIKKLAMERLPGESTRGVKLYAGLRAMQIRKLRMPAPKVKPGATV